MESVLADADVRTGDLGGPATTDESPTRCWRPLQAR
jgi:hypothetical protein